MDEEVGRGTDHFDLDPFGAEFAYTLDGAEVGEVENETFSAIELKVDHSTASACIPAPRRASS